MKFCSNCGKQLPDNAKFCTGCGTSLGEPVAPVAPNQQPLNPQPVFQQPAPVPAPKKKGGKGLIIAIIAILLVAALGVGIWALIENDVFGSTQGKDKDDDEDGKDNDKDNDEDDDPVVELPDDPAEAIVGEWYYDIIFNSMTIAGGEWDDFNAECSLPVVFCFTEDGEVSIRFYEEDPKWDQYFDDFLEFYIEYSFYRAEMNGMTEEEFEDYAQENYGMSVREYCEEWVHEGYESLIPDDTDSYEIDDEMLTIGGYESEYEFKNGKLYLYDSQLDFLEYVEMPIVLKKVG